MTITNLPHPLMAKFAGNQSLHIRVEDIEDFSVRTKNALINFNIFTVGDILVQSEISLGHVIGLGTKSKKKIKNYLSQLGFEPYELHDWLYDEHSKHQRDHGKTPSSSDDFFRKTFGAELPLNNIEIAQKVTIPLTKAMGSTPALDAVRDKLTPAFIESVLNENPDIFSGFIQTLIARAENKPK